VVVNFTDCLVLHMATGKVVNIMVLCQGLREMGYGACKSPYPLELERLPAEYGYSKRTPQLFPPFTHKV